MSLHEMLRILSITPLEKTPMIQLLPALQPKNISTTSLTEVTWQQSMLDRTAPCSPKWPRRGAHQSICCETYRTLVIKSSYLIIPKVVFLLFNPDT